MITAREAALLTLNEVFYNNKYSNLAVKETLSKCRNLEKNDKALFTNIVYGVISNHYTIEYVLSKHSSIKLKKLARYVKLILEIGIYQILYLDKIPDSAVVNEAVKLSYRYCKKDANRFINGVLRAICRDKSIDYPSDKTEYLSVKYSFNPEMSKMLIEQFGYETADKIMSSLNKSPKMLLRPNITKTNAEELSLLLKEKDIDNNVSSDGMIEAVGFNVAECDLYLQGYYTPQDRGAYNASIVLSPKEGQTIIDMCSAPGGKTTHLAEIMGDKGRIIACDIHPHKIQLINNNANRLGLKCIEAIVSDSTVFHPEYENIADCVLCDVPCSGWGIIRRKPDIKFSHTDLEELYEIQADILNNASRYIKSGGSIVYSTCTINKSENENRVNRFLTENTNFKKEYEKTFYPYEDDSDGFYICRMIKND